MERDERDDFDREERREHRRHHRRHRRRGRKERVLHTRVSDALADDIRKIAEDLRVPASNLVRNVLEEVFDVVETVTDDVGGLFDDLLDEAEATRNRIRKQRSRGESRRREAREWSRERARDRDLWRAARAEADDVEFSPGPDRSHASPVSPPPIPVDWHVVEDGRSVGPFRSDELAAAIRSGRIGRETPVWCAGMGDWLAAGSVAALEPLFQPPPPPESPPPPPLPETPGSGSGGVDPGDR